MGYTTPADVGISSSWADHKYRNPPSVEPGTDYATAYGTAIRMAGSGVVSDVNYSTGGGTGRYVKINLDDGRAVRYLHLKKIVCVPGQRLAQGQLFAESGASGFGSEWGYGPHVHTTLLPSPSYALRDSIDFALYVGGGSAPAPSPTPTPPEEDEEMNVVLYLYTPNNSLLLVDHLNKTIRNLGSVSNTLRQHYELKPYIKVNDAQWAALVTGYAYVAAPNVGAGGLVVQRSIDGVVKTISKLQDDADTNTMVRGLVADAAQPPKA
ncbi:MAG TPA: M23 family metallopeptidase [Microlunatus sp.]